MNKERFTGFSDAIIAIEVTILILEIEPPEQATLAAVLKQGGSFAAVSASLWRHGTFITILLMSLTE